MTSRFKNPCGAYSTIASRLTRVDVWPDFGMFLDEIELAWGFVARLLIHHPLPSVNKKVHLDHNP